MAKRAAGYPAVPLVVCDPFLSIWSESDNLYDDAPYHWTGTAHPLSGYIRVDGAAYRFLGRPELGIPPFPQKDVRVRPTRTVYRFADERVELTLTFMTPCLPGDLDLFSWPLAYISWSVRSADGREHEVSLYFDAYADIAVDSWEQETVWARYRLERLGVLRVGSSEQPILGKVGDFRRIDWGHLYLALPDQFPGEARLTTALRGLETFRATGGLPPADDLDMPRRVRLHRKSWEETPVLACALDLGRVDLAPKSAFVMLAYDDLFSVEFMHRRLRPYWRKAGRDMGGLLEEARASRERILLACETFDEELEAELRAAGGEDYVVLGSLAFRQAAGAQKLVRDFDGTPLHFSKENTSNGCIATVDVTYPTSPFALRFNPELLRAELTPVLRYAASEHWPHPFAPHDIGTYPLANGQVYRGGVHTKEQMPVEECGNMLILVSALTRVDGHADFAKAHWVLLAEWADYLAANGFAPDDQLCTDDFAGTLARNANLSLKAIVALGAFADVCRLAGEMEAEKRYSDAARSMARKWVSEAEDGDHYALAFGAPGTWSLKYNLIWDKILGLGLFPAEVAAKELALYRSKMNLYGCPLDNRSDYTKLDWEVWAASLAETREGFAEFLAPILRFVRESPDRVPLSDWYYTSTARYERFQSRSVVGGVFIRLLENRFTAAPRR